MTDPQGTHDAAPHRGRADLHIHSLASDGTSSVGEILDHVERTRPLDVIAITDHERIDAAVAARTMAEDRGLRVEVIVGEEITTLGGHLLGLFLERPVKPFRSLRASIAAIHDQGGARHPGPPARPLPALRPGLRAPPARGRRATRATGPTPWRRSTPPRSGATGTRQVVAFADEHGPAPDRQQRRARRRSDVGPGLDDVPGQHAGRPAAGDPRRRRPSSTARSTAPSVRSGRSAKQLRKYGRDARAELGGRIRRDGTGRDLGYPGGTRRPAVFDREAIPADEDRASSRRTSTRCRAA